MGKTTRAIVLTIAAALFFLPLAGCDNPVNLPPDEFTITQGIPAPTNGSFEISPTTAIAGTRITLTLTANSGYEFISWTFAGAEVDPVAGSDAGVWTFYMPAANITVKAVFRAEEAEVFQITKGTHANGTLTISPDEAAEGETVTLTATANSGYAFYRWDITGADVTPAAGSDAGVWTFYMPAANLTVSAVFRVIVDNGNGDENGAVLVDSGQALRSNQGTGVNAAATEIVDFASLNLRNVRFVAENFQTLSGNSRFHSIWLELSSGDAIGVTGRRVSTANPGIDRFGVGLGARSNMMSGSAATHVAIGAAPGFQVTSDAGIPTITARFPGFNLLSNTLETANVYDISVDITPAGAGTLSIRLAGRSPNGEWGALSEPVVRTFEVAPGTIVTSAHAWSHTGSTMTIPNWRLYGAADGGGGGQQQPPQGVPGNFTAWPGHGGTAVLAWQAVPSADAYEVRHRRSGGSWSSPVNVGNVLTYTFTGLGDGQMYEFGVQARNQYGVSTGGWAQFGPVEINAPDLNVDAGVWFETIFAYWTGTGGSTYNIYVAPANTPVDAPAWRWVNNPSEAVAGHTWRNNHSHLARVVNPATNRWRVDVPGLAANNNQSYDLRIVELVGGVPGRSHLVTNLRPPPFDRQGFAFSETSPFGHTTGAYNRDGTLRSDAIVLYVTSETITNFAAHNPWNATFGAVFNNNRMLGSYNNVTIRNQRPVAVRFIGTVSHGSAAQIRRMANVTLAGIGPDAELNFSLYIMRSANVVVRNLTFRNWGSGDGITIESNAENGTDPHSTQLIDTNGTNANFDRVSTNTWVTHNTFFSNASVDGQIDVNCATYHTQSWNVFNQMGGDNRGGLVGGTQRRSHARVTFHNNLYNNVRTRAPRLRISEAHIFNNVHLGGGQAYAVGAGHHAHAIVEGNYYSNLARTLIMAGQGIGAGTLGNDQPGFLVTTDTTSARHTTATHRWVDTSGDRIFALAAVLQPNVMTGSPAFNPNVDQGFPTLNNSSGEGRDFLWNFQNESSWAGASNFVLSNQSTWPMPVSVTTAQIARIRVQNYAGPMRRPGE